MTRRLGPAGSAEDADSARLVEELQSGRRAAFDQLYHRYFDRVFAYLAVALGDHHAAEDITQRVFLRVLEKIECYELRPDASFRSWLFGVARYESLNHTRRHRRIEVTSPEEIGRHLDGGPPDHDRHPAHLIPDSELSRLVARLPAAQRQVVALHYVVGLQLSQIATLMGRSPEAVRQLHRRALVHLERRLGVRREARGRVIRAAMRVFMRESAVASSRRLALSARRF